MMPKVDPENSAQNAFVQDWLIAWAKKNTVYGSNDWYRAARVKIKANEKWAREWNVHAHNLVEEAALIEKIIDHIQETYSEEDKEERKNHFAGRFPDIHVTGVTFDRDLAAVQVDGNALDGSRVWILLHCRQPITFVRGGEIDPEG